MWSSICEADAFTSINVRMRRGVAATVAQSEARYSTRTAVRVPGVQSADWVWALG